MNLLRSLTIGSVLLLAACTSNVTPGGNSSSSSPAAPQVQVTQPLPNVVVTSPLVVTGEAPGSWYFEASFPVRLLDGDGNQIAQAPAQAQGDWMTSDPVPFIATLTFNPPATATGTLVLEKDNPSGLPQNAGSIEVPVTF